MLSAPRKDAEEEWTNEELFFDGDSFFADVIAGLDSASRTIAVESYIFERDILGERVAAALERAAARGVEVRVLVDAIGSPGWVAHYGERLNKAGVKFRVFHRLPWKKEGGIRPPSFRTITSLNWLRRLNRRNHRKLIIVDDERAWVGSMNISAVHLAEVHGANAWRDTSLFVEGPQVVLLRDAFDRASLSWRKRVGTKAVVRPRSRLVRLNSNRRWRKFHYRDLVRRLREAKEKIWITTPYFVPSGKIVDALTHAAARGVDVRLLVPGRSDVFFMSWVAAAFHSALLPAGARIFEYSPSVLHAKVLQIDDWATVGSSNFNHRSLFHDLEVDVVVSRAEHRAELSERFLTDTGQSIEAKWESRSLRSAFMRMLGRLLLRFRHWL